MEPRFVERGEFRVAGFAARFAPDRTEGIPALWDRVVTGWSTAGAPFPDRSYGLCYDEGEVTAEDGPEFTYVAGFELGEGETPPEGMEVRTVPPNRYAVFTATGGIPGIHETYRYIFGTWLPNSGHRRGAGPDFELYDDRFDPETMAGEVDIYVPVRTG